MRQDTKLLLSIDPGKSTGIAMIDVSDMDDPKKLWSAEVSVSEFHDKIEELMKQPHLEVVIEDFKITAATGKLSEAPWSLKLIGVVEYLSQKHNVPVTLQKPSQKPFATNDRLRTVGFWHVGEDGHAVDAFKHALIWCVTNNKKFAGKLIM